MAREKENDDAFDLFLRLQGALRQAPHQNDEANVTQVASSTDLQNVVAPRVDLAPFEKFIVRGADLAVIDEQLMTEDPDSKVRVDDDDSVIVVQLTPRSAKTSRVSKKSTRHRLIDSSHLGDSFV